MIETDEDLRIIACLMRKGIAYGFLLGCLLTSAGWYLFGPEFFCK